MSDTKAVRAAITERNKWPVGSLDWSVCHRVAWKLLQIAAGVPVIEWTEYPERKRQ